MKNKKILVLILLCTALLSFAVGYGLAFPMQAQTSAPEPEKHFFSDDIVIFSPNIEGEPFLLQLELNRKQTPSEDYVHYYFLDFLWKGENASEYIQFNQDESSVTARRNLLFFQNKQAFDLSTRETYDFELELGSQNIEISLKNLNGDFIVRNMLDYTKYLSIGDAEVTIDGKTYAMQAAVSKIYSPNFSTYIFFDGHGQLNSITDYLVLWDENENFYLVDTTKTAHEDFNYKSHTWVLTKNKETQSLRKAFAVEMQKDASRNTSITIPDFSVNLTLSMPQHFKGKPNEGLAEGVIITPDGSAKIGGSIKHVVY